MIVFTDQELFESKKIAAIEKLKLIHSKGKVSPREVINFSADYGILIPSKEDFDALINKKCVEKA